LRPYLGVGGGFNLQQMQGIAGDAGSSTQFGVKTWGLGYQGIIGLSYQTKRCNNLFLEYRYYGTSDTNLRKISTVVTQQPITEVGQNDKFNIDQNSIVFGLRINR
jgi:opacity protein-like surface antigen